METTKRKRGHPPLPGMTSKMVSVKITTGMESDLAFIAYVRKNTNQSALVREAITFYAQALKAGSTLDCDPSPDRL